MSLYRSSVISQVPVNFRHANALRRESLTRASSPGLGLSDITLLEVCYLDDTKPRSMLLDHLSLERAPEKAMKFPF